MIVVDTNVIAYLLIQGARTSLAEEVYRKDSDWLLPALWRHEFLNVLSTYVRYGGGREKDGLQIWARAMALFGGNEGDMDLKKAFHFSVVKDVSAYDAQFIVLAQELRTQLITDDRKLLAAFPDLAQSMQAYVDT